MVTFCSKLFYQFSKAVNEPLWLRMARIEKGCNLKKLGQCFQVFLCGNNNNNIFNQGNPSADAVINRYPGKLKIANKKPGYRHPYTVNIVPAFAVKVLKRANQRNPWGTRLFRILYPPISSINETPA